MGYPGPHGDHHGPRAPAHGVRPGSGPAIERAAGHLPRLRGHPDRLRARAAGARAGRAGSQRPALRSLFIRGLLLRPGPPHRAGRPRPRVRRGHRGRPGAPGGIVQGDHDHGREAIRRPEVRSARTIVYLARHGSVVGAESRRFIGHLDMPLSPRGEAESIALARRLAGTSLAAAYSSDLVRTRRTAEEIRTREPVAFEAWMADIGRFQFPEGESLPEVEARAWPAFEAIAARHAGESVLVVAHGGPNRIVLCRALGLPLERILMLGQDYAALSVLEGNRDRWVLRLLNHREPLASG